MISLTAAVHVFQGGLKRGGLKLPSPVLAQGGWVHLEGWLCDCATTWLLLGVVWLRVGAIAAEPAS